MVRVQVSGFSGFALGFGVSRPGFAVFGVRDFRVSRSGFKVLGVPGSYFWFLGFALGFLGLMVRGFQGSVF